MRYCSESLIVHSFVAICICKFSYDELSKYLTLDNVRHCIILPFQLRDFKLNRF